MNSNSSINRLRDPRANLPLRNPSLATPQPQWQRILQALTTPPELGSEILRARARATLLFNTIFLTANLGLLIAAFAFPFDSRTVPFGIALVDIVISIVVYWLVRTKQLRAASAVLTMLLLVSYTVSIVNTNGETTLAVLIALPLVYSGFTLGVPAMLFVDLIGLAGFAIAIFTNNSGNSGIAGSDVFAVPIILFVLTGMIGLLARAQERTLLRSEQIASQLRAAAQLSQATLSTLDLDVLLQRTIDYIRDQFGFYHAQIFLIDAQHEYAVLAASTGEAGAALMARGHRLAIGSRSVIGQVTQNGQPFITEDTAADPIHRPNDLLPNTRAEMAIPLLLGNEIIGALDVQSTRPNIFNNDDIDSLRIVAAQVSSAVRNAQLFAEQSATAEQNQRLFDQAERNLDEIEQLNQRLTTAAWGEYLQAQPSGALGITIENGTLSRQIRPVDSTATVSGKPGISALPLIIGGRTIGSIEVELPPDAATDETRAIVQAVADRLVFSLENARLLEQSEASAQQEATVNLISARMQGASNINELLRVTVGELGRGLGAQKGIIRLISPSASDDLIDGNLIEPPDHDQRMTTVTDYLPGDAEGMEQHE